jgi:hypothetical protein
MGGPRLRTAVPETCGMVDGRRACGISGSPFATPVPMIGMVGGRPCLWLRVDGQWSMVVAIRSRSMGSEAREGMVRCCRASVGALDSSPPSWSPPTMGTWGLGRRSIGPWPGWPRCVSGRRLDFCRKCLPGADPNAFRKEVVPARVRISFVISMVGAQGLEPWTR